MTKRYHNALEFSSLKRRKVEVAFEGGDITSDGGAILLWEMDKRIGLTECRFSNKAGPCCQCR